MDNKNINAITKKINIEYSKNGFSKKFKSLCKKKSELLKNLKK